MNAFKIMKGMVDNQTHLPQPSPPEKEAWQSSIMQDDGTLPFPAGLSPGHTLGKPIDLCDGATNMKTAK